MSDKGTSAQIDIKLVYDNEISSLEQTIKQSNAKIKASQRKNAAEAKKLTKAQLATEEKLVAVSQKKIEGLRLKSTQIIGDRMRSNWLSTNKDMTNISRVEAKKQENIQRKAANSFGSKFGKAFGTLTRYASAGTAIFTVVNAFKQIGLELLAVEKAMYRVSAITGTAISDNNKLIDSIYNISTSYGISVDDITKFAIEMAKLGKTTDEINAISSSAASLSVILGEDMVTSGKTIVTTMNQFNLVTSESSRVAGVFSSAIKNSPLATGDLATALQYTGTAANAAGISIEKLGSYMTLLSNNGLRASKIGTGLRNVILNMAKDGDTFSDSMDKLYNSGLSLSEALEKFGKRGATAAYIMVQNWQELKEIQDNIPTQIEQITTALITASSTSSEFAKIWNKIKGVFSFLSKNRDTVLFPAESVSKSTNEIEKLTNAAKKANYLFSQFKVDASNAMDKVYHSTDGVNDVMEILNEQWGHIVMGETPQMLRDLEQTLKLLKEINEEQKLIRGNTQDTTESFANERDSIYKDVANETITIDEATVKLEKLAERYSKALQNFTVSDVEVSGIGDLSKSISTGLGDAVNHVGLSITEADKKAKKFIDEGIGGIRQNFSINMEALAEKTKIEMAANAAILKEIADNAAAGLETKGITEQYSIDADNEKDRIKKVRAFLCSHNYIEFCDPKPVADDVIKDMKWLFDIVEAELRKQMSAANTESSVTADDFFRISMDSVISPTDAKKMKEFLDKDGEFVVSAYNEYIENIKLGIISGIESLGKAELDVFTASYKPLLENLRLEQANLKQQAIGIDPNSEEGKSFQVRIGTIEKEIDNLDKTYEKGYSDIEQKNKKRVEDVGLLGGISPDDIEEEYNNIKEVIAQALGVLKDIYEEFSQARIEQLKRVHDAELESIDARYKTEGDILKAQLESNLITEGQYAKKRKQLEKKKIAEENQVKKSYFEAQKKQDIQNAIIKGTVAAAQAALTTVGTFGLTGIPLSVITTAFAVATAAASVAAISKRTFVPVKYATGGLITGASHAGGGVPISVSRSNPIEAEGGEYIVNRESTAQNLPLLESINNSKKYSPTHFETGGRIPSDANNDNIIKALGEVKFRAYFTGKDLDAASRNNTITTKRTVI